jgi:rhodanese-related sulfurtransferase
MNFEQAVRDAKTRIREIDAASARARFDAGDVTFVDVREPIELARGGGTVPGALHVPLGALFAGGTAALPREGAIVVLCEHGLRSALATDALGRMGFEDVASLAGGWQAWTAGGHPRGPARSGGGGRS